MTRFVRLFALTLLLLAMATPSFAFCRFCNANSICERDPNFSTRCQQSIDFCTDIGTCAAVASRATLLDQYAVASVEVTTPAGVTKTAETPRVASLTHRPHTTTTR
ncbi:MAG: hypothetical protein QOI24_3699 [Acidobacteriota bacterium]|jgi:hypothetical protein|nr:hypothetical protein [Acidobacteriota bacterium]